MAVPLRLSRSRRIHWSSEKKISAWQRLQRSSLMTIWLVGARPIDIEIDGGVTAENAARVVQAGANVLVAGSAVFKSGNYKASIAAIRNAAALARGEAA